MDIEGTRQVRCLRRRLEGLATSMPIVAVDPGTTESAVVAWDGERVLAHKIVPNEVLLRVLEHPVLDGSLAVEMIASYGMAVGREVFETCVWIGKFLHAWGRLRSSETIFRKEVKIELCGSSKAKDGNVRQALLDRIGPQGTRKDPGPTYGLRADEWAALGVAVTARAKKGAGT